LNENKWSVRCSGKREKEKSKFGNNLRVSKRRITATISSEVGMGEFGRKQ